MRQLQGRDDPLREAHCLAVDSTRLAVDVEIAQLSTFEEVRREPALLVAGDEILEAGPGARHRQCLYRVQRRLHLGDGFRACDRLGDDFTESVRDEGIA
jgi:hypothetical protein